MNTARSVIVFDVNETLSDMSPMGERFAEVGAPAQLAKLWFATLLRDGFALTAAGGNGAFAEIGAEVLRGLLAASDIGMDLDHAVVHVMAGMAGLGLHPGVPEGVRALRATGYRLVTLSNGAQAKSSNVHGVEFGGQRYYYQLTRQASFDPLRLGAIHDYAIVTVVDAGTPWEVLIYHEK